MKGQTPTTPSALDLQIESHHKQYGHYAFGGERVDRCALTRAFKDAYAVMGCPPPQLFVYESPLACMQAIFALTPSAPVEIFGTATARFGQPLWNRLDLEFRQQTGLTVRDKLKKQLMVRLGRQIGQLSALLGSTLGDHEAWNPDFLWGSQDLHHIALGKFALQAGMAFSPDIVQGLSITERIGQQCEWWWPFEDRVIASERPVSVAWDDNHLLHCDHGPAVRYSDGLELFAWHGLGVPPHWVLAPNTITPAEVIQQRNVELRLAGAAIVGWSKMFSVLDCRIIDDSGCDDIGQLIELTLPGLPDPGRFLKATCPRNGIIVEGVPYVSDIDGLPIETAIAAQAWRIGDPQSEYQHPPRRT